MAFGALKSGIQWFGRQVSGLVDRQIAARQEQAGAQWLALSRSLAPEDTGQLKAEEDYEVRGRDLILIMGAGHDIFQEFGTRFISAQPHVRPALNAINRVWGGEIEMNWNVPEYANPVIAVGAGFVMPKTLTAKQRRHVERNLAPTSKRLHKGNVRRARMRVRRLP